MRPNARLRAQRFSEEVKEAAVQRFLTSDLSFAAVAEQFGTSRYSVANWVKLAHSRGEVKKPKPTLIAAATPTDNRSASEKLRLIVAAGSISEEQLGEFLRREGLRDGDLERFRAEALGGLEGKVHSAQDRRQIQELERVNAKQAKRLREAEVLLELQKKVQELWGAKGDGTTKD
jgi:transposase-like protein